MFHRHPLITWMNISFVLLSFYYLKNNLILFLLTLLFYIHDSKKQLFSKLLLLLSIVNLGVNWFSIGIKGVLVLLYFREIVHDDTKIEKVQFLDRMFPYLNKRRKSSIIKLIYGKEIFLDQYQLWIDAKKRIEPKKNIDDYVLIIKQCMIKSKQELDKILVTYEKTLYFNENKNRNCWKIEVGDLCSLGMHLCFYLVILYFGRRPYAIFNKIFL